MHANKKQKGEKGNRIRLNIANEEFKLRLYAHPRKKAFWNKIGYVTVPLLRNNSTDASVYE